MRIDSPQKRKKSQIMRELCHERKLQNFQCLKKWDMSRASKLIIHRKIVDEIDESLETKISQSTDYIRIVRQFFTDLLNQKVFIYQNKGNSLALWKNRYVSHLIQNPQQKMKMNPFSRNVYPTPSRTLIKIYESQQHLKQAQRIKKVLQESLQRIDEFLLEGEKQLMQIRTRVQLLVLQMQDCNMSTVHKCDELVGLYNSTKSLKPLMSQQDFFMAQQQFLLQARKQLKCQRQLGAQIVQYWQMVMEKQQKKVLLIKEIIGDYVSSLKNQSAPEYLSSLTDILSKNTQSKYVEEYFSPEQLLTRQLISQLARVQSKHESQITVKFLKSFLKKFQYEQFDNRNLVLKAIKVFIRSQVEQNISSQNQLEQKLAKDSQKQQQISTILEPIQIYVTVDGFINIYKITPLSSNSSLDQKQTEDQTENQQRSFLYSLKISQSLSFNRISDLQLNLNLKKWGLISFTQPQEQQLTLLFHSEDQREEFLQFIVRLK